MAKRLIWEDMKPSDSSDELEGYTDEDARRHGYPSLEVMRLEYQLTKITGEWRRTKENSLVHDYKAVLYEMILKGYDVNILPVQDQLPDDLMPDLPPKPIQKAIIEAYQEMAIN